MRWLDALVAVLRRFLPSTSQPLPADPPAAPAPPPVTAPGYYMIAGDSIAVGTASVLTQCRSNAKVGIPSAQIIARVDPAAALNVISAGSNDATNPKLRANLEAIRARSKAAIWIVPQNRNAAAQVRAVAQAHGDPVVTFTAGSDGIHPKSYRVLAADVAKLLPSAN